MKKSETRLVVSPTIRNAQTARIGTVRIALWLAISMLLIMGIALQPLAALLSPTLAALLPQAKSALAAPPQQAGTATIGNFVWNDLDKDGIQDAGEPGIVGVSMALYTPAGALVQSTASIAGGAYAFNNVAAGTYLVSVEPSNFAIGNLVGFGLSPTGVGTPSTDSNGVFVAGASIYTATIGAGVDQQRYRLRLLRRRQVDHRQLRLVRRQRRWRPPGCRERVRRRHQRCCAQSLPE
jgi:hypothetical protein